MARKKKRKEKWGAYRPMAAKRIFEEMMFQIQKMKSTGDITKREREREK